MNSEKGAANEIRETKHIRKREKKRTVKMGEVRNNTQKEKVKIAKKKVASLGERKRGNEREKMGK